MNDEDEFTEFFMRNEHRYDIVEAARRISARVAERLERRLRRRKQIKLAEYVCMGFSQN